MGRLLVQPRGPLRFAVIAAPDALNEICGASSKAMRGSSISHLYQFMIYYDSHDMWRYGVVPSSYTIGDHFEHFVKEQVEGGSYASASEVIRDGLRLLEEEQQRRKAVIDGLRGEIERGRRSGKPKPAAEVLDRLERKYTKMVKERAK
jgi:antitoxin ParD1/3/4